MNGKAENNNRILLEATRTLLQNAGLSSGYWTFALRTATYCYNRSIIVKKGKSPWSLIYGSKPDINHLHIFGIIGYSHVPRETRTKLEPTAVRARILGYAEDSVGYVVQDIETMRIFYSRTFYCNEEEHEGPTFQNNNLLGRHGSYISADSVGLHTLINDPLQGNIDLDDFDDIDNSNNLNLLEQDNPTTTPTQST